jgi:beta-mannosidase
LALICGNNEIEVALKNWGWQQKYNIHGFDSVQLWNSYKHLFDTFIPRKLQNIDSNIFYLPSSPIGNWGNLKQMKVGDNHDWGIWHGERNFNHVDSVNAPFVSEFGFPSLPRGIKESVDSMKYQNLEFRSYKGLSLLNRYVKTEINNLNQYRVFPSLNMTVLNSTKNFISSRTQALFLDRAIRAYRTSSADFGGCLFWQWNDVDRVVSWSVVDSDMNNKPAFEQLKYSLKPTVVFARCTDTSIRVSAQSISLTPQKYTAKVYVMSPNKTMVFQMLKPIIINGFAEFTINVKSNVLLKGNVVHVQLVNANGILIDEI